MSSNAPTTPVREREKGLTRMDARMVMGLPGSEQSQAWLREALSALQASDPRADVDLNSIEERLIALEARRDADLSPVWEALGALGRRIAALEGLERRLAATEAALAELLAREPAPPAAMDPLDPNSWDSLTAAKSALEVLVTREAARRCGQAVSLYETMVRLDALGDARTPDEDLQLMQHHGWARERQVVELARLEHNSHIRALSDLGQAMAYDWKAGWPAVEDS
jgi:hypothetical protein